MEPWIIIHFLITEKYCFFTNITITYLIQPTANGCKHWSSVLIICYLFNLTTYYNLGNATTYGKHLLI